MRILYLDDNDYQRQLYTVYLENILDNIEVFDESSTNNALIKLKKIPNLSLVLCSNLKDGRLSEIYNYVKNNLMQVPFILLGQESPDEIPVLSGFKSHNDKNGNIKLPISPVAFRETILNILCPSRFSIAVVHAFKKIRILHFYRFNKVLCNVYIKLSDRKYIKVFNQNVLYLRSDVDKLLEKSVDFLYIRNDDFDKFHVSFSKNPFLVNTSENRSPEETAELLAITQSLMQKMVINLGFTKEVAELAEVSIGEIIKLSEVSPSIFDIIKNMRKDMNYIYDHSYLVAVVCCDILKQMKWNTPEKVRNLCMAALFHDMTLKNPEMAMIQDQSDIRLKYYSENEIKEYLSHPFEAANILANCDFASPEVLDIIRQHHENSEGQGFPNKLHPSRLSPLVCSFIIAHEFVNEIYKTDFDPALKDGIIDKMMAKYKNGNFKAPLMAFVKEHGAELSVR